MRRGHSQLLEIVGKVAVKDAIHLYYQGSGISRHTLLPACPTTPLGSHPGGCGSVYGSSNSETLCRRMHRRRYNTVIIVCQRIPYQCPGSDGDSVSFLSEIASAEDD